MTVQIPRGLDDIVEGFLNTKQAESMGFDSKADDITTDVRHLLMEFGYYKILKKRGETNRIQGLARTRSKKSTP